MNEHSRTNPENHLRLLRKRKPDAVERWFLEHGDAVYTFVFYRVGKDEDLAADVVQETFVTALRKIRQYDPKRGAMSAWLTYIARNCIRKALREKGRLASYSELWDSVDRRLLVVYGKLATTPLPEEVLDRKETAELVHMALSSIPGNYQRALCRRYFQHQPLEEIARGEGLTEGAVKSMLHRARLAFKAAFQTIAETLDERPTAGEVIP